MRTPAAEVPDGVDGRRLRTAMGRFVTGVTIVTCRDTAGQPVGLTVNSFSSLSLDPPLLLWSLRRASPAVAAFSAAGSFAVNVLSLAQIGLSRRFASSARDRFAEGQWTAGAGGVPVLQGAVAVFECETASQQVAGDHLLFIGRVLACHETHDAPLLFQAGHYRKLGELA